MRELTQARSGRVTLTFDGASTYTLQIENVEHGVQIVATPANVDVAQTITDIAANITADVGIGAGDIVTATAIESVAGGGIDTLLLIGKASEDWFLSNLEESGGAGTLTATLDRTSTQLKVYGLPSQDGGPGVYLQLNGGTYLAPKEGFVDRFDSAGIARFYVELFDFVVPAADSAGPAGTINYRDPDILMGPAILE